MTCLKILRKLISHGAALSKIFLHGAAPCKIFSHGAAPCKKCCSVQHRARSFRMAQHQAKFFARRSAVQKNFGTLRHRANSTALHRAKIVAKCSTLHAGCCTWQELLAKAERRATENWLKNFIDNSDLLFGEVVNAVLPYKALRHRSKTISAMRRAHPKHR